MSRRVQREMAGAGAKVDPGKESRCSCTALRKATRRVSQLYDLALAPSGLKITQRAVLAQIDRSGWITVGNLAASLVMDSGALAHTLKPLEREGFVAIKVDPEDRRSRLLALTPEGKAKLTETEALWARAQDGFDMAIGAKSGSFREILQILVSDDFVASFKEAVLPLTELE